MAPVAAVFAVRSRLVAARALAGHRAVAERHDRGFSYSRSGSDGGGNGWSLTTRKAVSTAMTRRGGALRIAGELTEPRQLELQARPQVDELRRCHGERHPGQQDAPREAPCGHEQERGAP